MVAHSPYNETGISGTKLNKLIVERNIQQWSRLSFSSVYYTLNQLEKKNLITSKEVKTNSNSISDVGAPQKLFIVTPKGLKVLKKTVLHYFQNMDLNYHEMNLALAGAFVLTDKEFLNIIKQYTNRINERVAIVRGRFAEDSTHTHGDMLPIHVWALFNYAFYSLNAKNDFLKELTKKLELNIEQEERRI